MLQKHFNALFALPSAFTNGGTVFPGTRNALIQGKNMAGKWTPFRRGDGCGWLLGDLSRRCMKPHRTVPKNRTLSEEYRSVPKTDTRTRDKKVRNPIKCLGAFGVTFWGRARVGLSLRLFGHHHLSFGGDFFFKFAFP